MKYYILIFVVTLIGLMGITNKALSAPGFASDSLYKRGDSFPPALYSILQDDEVPGYWDDPYPIEFPYFPLGSRYGGRGFVGPSGWSGGGSSGGSPPCYCCPTQGDCFEVNEYWCKKLCKGEDIGNGQACTNTCDCITEYANHSGTAAYLGKWCRKSHSSPGRPASCQSVGNTCN